MRCPAAVPALSRWIVFALIVSTCAGEFTTVLNNSLMPRLVPSEQLGRLSGAGWALGYVGGLISLIIMVAFILIDAQTGLTMLGLDPVYRLRRAVARGRPFRRAVLRAVVRGVRHPLFPVHAGRARRLRMRCRSRSAPPSPR